MNYEQKYLKYKKKYSYLKSINQIGGGFPFQRGGTFTLMLVFTGDTLDRINERRTALGLPPSTRQLHMTLLQIHINFDHPLHNIFLQRQFRDCVLQAVQTSLDTQQDPLILTSPHGQWNILGQNENQYWARIYNFDQQLIRNFRTAFYNCLNTRLPTGQRFTHAANQPRNYGGGGTTNYDIWSTGAGELYAVNSDFYVGAQNWLPHISVFELGELDQQPPNPNRDLLRILNNPARTILDKNTAINGRINANTVGIGQADVRAISTLNIRDNMRQILISVRGPPGHQRIPDVPLNL